MAVATCSAVCAVGCEVLGSADFRNPGSLDLLGFSFAFERLGQLFEGSVDQTVDEISDFLRTVASEDMPVVIDQEFARVAHVVVEASDEVNPHVLGI